MKTACLFIIYFLSFSSLFSQQKGASPIPNTPLPNTQQQTYAVVVGISDYQDKGIPDLQFADKDAEAFATWLHSSPGGSVPADNIRLLTNEMATIGQVNVALSWLAEEAGENDRVVIYFSGHGDMTANILNQLGYLLLWDSPAHVYVAGALPVDMLKNVITHISTVKKSKVLVVADACRAGKLAGRDIIGPQLTNANLSKQFANEHKILSCQANEFSIEGEQWGNGRGVFSYHLINGLNGMADLNGDREISLLEIERFLVDNVTPEVKPISQIPIVVGDKKEVVARVNDLVQGSDQGEITPIVPFSGIEQRGLYRELASRLDSNIIELYLAFNESLVKKQFFTPESGCSEYYFNKLMKVHELEPLRSTMRRNYAAALQDDAQQVLNNILKVNYAELSLTRQALIDKYQEYPPYLERAAELLGEGHYMYSTLLARKVYFEGFLHYLKNTGSDKEESGKTLMILNEAIKIEPNLPHVYQLISHVYSMNFMMADSAEYFAHRATELAPTWVLPFANLANYQCNHFGNLDKAREYLEMANEIDSVNWYIYNAWGEYYGATHEFDRAEDVLKKAIALNAPKTCHSLGFLYAKMGRVEEAEKYLALSYSLDTLNFRVPLTLGFLYINSMHFEKAIPLIRQAISMGGDHPQVRLMLGVSLSNIEKYQEALKEFETAYTMNPNFADPYIRSAECYAHLNDTENANAMLERVINLPTLNTIELNGIGLAYMLLGNYEQGEIYVRKSLEANPHNEWALYNLVCLNSIRKNYEEAFDWLEKTLEIRIIPNQKYQEDTDLDNIRVLDKFDELMRKYFPDQYKN